MRCTCMLSRSFQARVPGRHIRQPAFRDTALPQTPQSIWRPENNGPGQVARLEDARRTLTTIGGRWCEQCRRT